MHLQRNRDKKTSYLAHWHLPHTSHEELVHRYVPAEMRWYSLYLDTKAFNTGFMSFGFVLKVPT